MFLIRYSMQLLIWCTLYFSCGYLSLYLDDPASRVSFVWFPAGIAVSAFLLTPRHFWLPLFLGFFIVRTILDVTMRHSLETSLVHSVISLGNDFAIAWCVRHFSRQNDRLFSLVILLISTMIISVVAAVAGSYWSVIRYEVTFIHTVWIWWAANVVGTILLTTIAVGLYTKQKSFVLKHRLYGMTLWLLLCICTIYVFHEPVGGPHGEALLFSLACLPVIIMVTIPILSDINIGAISLLSFCVIVIYYSCQHNGPFFIHGLREGEPLLLAQCYLSGTALLFNFIVLLKRHVTSVSLCYYLNPRSGDLTWNNNFAAIFGQQFAKINHINELFSFISSDDQCRMRNRWEMVQKNGVIEDPFDFILTISPSEKFYLHETKLIALQQHEDVMLIGYWTGVFHNLVPCQIIEEK